MEYNWERTMPFINLTKKEISKLFEGVEREQDIINITPINEGCRTTNYIIESLNKKYILKIFFLINDNYDRECKLLDQLNARILVQRVIKISNDFIIDNRKYIIYEYLSGRTLGQSLKEGYKISETFIKDVAQSLAQIHKFKFNKVGFLDKDMNVITELPSLALWYDLFINDKIIKRLDHDTINRIKIIVEENKDKLDELDRDPRLVHGDFQGTNILVNNHKLSGILDWEFSMSGHPLGDIGEFFRYEEYFTDSVINKFKAEYNKYSDYKLKNDWYIMAKLRDLANLLQLLSGEKDMPNKYSNVKQIILNSLKYFS